MNEDFLGPLNHEGRLHTNSFKKSTKNIYTVIESFFDLKYYLPYLWLFQSNIMNVIGDNFFSNTINVVKIGKIHLFQNICSEFNESFNISDVLIRPRQAEENLFIDYVRIFQYL